MYCIDFATEFLLPDYGIIVFPVMAQLEKFEDSAYHPHTQSLNFSLSHQIRKFDPRKAQETKTEGSRKAFESKGFIYYRYRRETNEILPLKAVTTEAFQNKVKL